MKPKAGRFGITPVFVTGRQIDAGITASATVKIPVATPFRKLYVEKAGVSAVTLPIGGGAITATLYKKPVGGTAVALSAAIDLTVAAQTALVVGAVTILAAATDTQRIVLEGEYLYFDIIAAGTVTTQPAGLVFSIEVLVLE